MYWNWIIVFPYSHDRFSVCSHIYHGFSLKIWQSHYAGSRKNCDGKIINKRGKKIVLTSNHFTSVRTNNKDLHQILITCTGFIWFNSFPNIITIHTRFTVLYTTCQMHIFITRERSISLKYRIEFTLSKLLYLNVAFISQCLILVMELQCLTNVLIIQSCVVSILLF